MSASIRPTAELDRSWADRIRTGDARAYETVFRSLYPSLVTYVARIVDSQAVGEELVQEIFLTLWQRRATLEIAEGSLSAYLFTSARNRALAHLRREKVATRWRERATFDALIAERELSRDAGGRDGGGGMPDAVEVELSVAIAAAVAALPPRARQVFTMHRQGGRTYGEIAAELGVSLRTVENHMSAALKSLRARLARFL